MVDLSVYPPHIQEGVGQLDLACNALERTKRGAEWLDNHAPPDWRLNMISIRKGVVTSHVRMIYDDQDVLALAFKRSEGRRSDDRVTLGSLSDKLPIMHNPLEMQRCGFLTKQHLAPNNALVDVGIDGLFLDEAWASILKNLEWRAQPNSARKYAA